MTNDQHLNRRHTMGLGLAALANPLTRQKAIAATATPPVLIELFTSQGCSSCPPADKLAGELDKNPGNIVVTFNVDYWDYLGWRDTLAKPEYSQRQYDYAKTRGDGQVYTPQMIVNGGDHASGTSVSSLIEKARKHNSTFDLALEMSGKEIRVTIAEQPFKGEATLWLMAVAKEKRQKIERGENAGQQVVYHNAVRHLVPAAMWKGGPYQGTWMRNAVMLSDCTSCVAVLQRGQTGEVLAVARS